MAESPLSTAQPVPNVLPDFSFLPLFFLLENARCIEYSGHFSVSSYSSPMMMLNGKTPTVLSRLPGSDSLPVSHFFVSTHENWSSPLPLPHSLTDVRYKRNPIGYRWLFSLMCQLCWGSSGLDSRQRQKLLIGLDALGHKLSIPEQGVCGHRGGHIPRGLLVGDMDDF